MVDTRTATLPAGTEISVRLADAIDSETGRVGETFRATIDTALRDGRDVVVPRGSEVFVKLTQVQSAGDLRGKSMLEVELDRVIVGRDAYMLSSNAYSAEGDDQGKKAVRNTAVGAAIGAAIGAITGGPKGAAIGAGAGAGGGVGATVLLKGNQIEIPSESRLVFSLVRPVEITVMPGTPEEVSNRNSNRARLTVPESNARPADRNSERDDNVRRGRGARR